MHLTTSMMIAIKNVITKAIATTAPSDRELDSELEPPTLKVHPKTFHTTDH